MSSEHSSTTRRAFMRQLATLVGSSLTGAPILSALNSYGENARIASSAADVMNANQLKLLGEVVDLIIPETQTPGARALDVHHLIHHLLKNCSTRDESNQFLTWLDHLDALSCADHNRQFVNCAKNEQNAMLGAWDTLIETDRDSGAAQFMLTLKRLTLFGYYTSEIGASEELRYLPIPGGYRGSVPLSEVNRTWSI